MTAAQAAPDNREADRDAEHSEGAERPQQENGKGQGKNPGRGARVKNSHIIEEFINVGLPHQTVFDQWCQYDDWSKIFKKESGQKGGDKKNGKNGEDERNVTVTAKIGPSRRQWKAEVVRVLPGRRLEWEAKGGVQAKGVTTFHGLDDRLTHLQVVVQYRPSGFMETIGNFFRMPRRRVRKDLKLFKHYAELRGEATGSGPGEIGGDGLKSTVDQQVQSAQEQQQKKKQDQQQKEKGDEPGGDGGERSRQRRSGDERAEEHGSNGNGGGRDDGGQEEKEEGEGHGA